MLGEVVDHGFDVTPGSAVTPGQVLGWIEGFKAISDIFCVGIGDFLGGNPALQGRVIVVSQDPYDQGWLYAFKGQPDPHCVDVQAYGAILDEVIDRILEKQKQEQNP
jgi:glycine cleavage system H protein